MKNNLLTRTEKAKELGISLRTLDRKVKAGLLTPVSTPVITTKIIEVVDRKHVYFLPKNSGINESVEMKSNN